MTLTTVRVPVTRGTTNRNERGSAAKRRELKTWILGNGVLDTPTSPSLG